MSEYIVLKKMIRDHTSRLNRKAGHNPLSINESLYPKVSIVTPSFNQGRFLERTILSVLNQDWPNLEYIIIDGGSSDNSIEIIKRYEKYLSGWISEPDNGQTNAINKGIGRATGKYIIWLCSDDILLSGAVKLMVSALEKDTAAGIVYGGVAFIDKEDKILKKHAYSDITLEKLLYDKNSTIAQPSSLIHRETFDAAGGLDESLDYCMDYDLWIRLMRISRAINLGDTVLSGYRLHPGSKTIGSYTKMALEKIKVNRRYTKDIINRVIYAHYWYIVEAFVKSFIRGKRFD